MLSLHLLTSQFNTIGCYILMLFIMQKEQSDNPSSALRVKVWIKSRTRKNGEPVNKYVADTIVSGFVFLFKLKLFQIHL